VNAVDNWILNTEVKDVYCPSFPSSAHQSWGLNVQKSILLAAIQKEIHCHDLSYFVDEPPSVAQGGRGVVVAGCPACGKRINTDATVLGSSDQ
jgi:hypothetical protein